MKILLVPDPSAPNGEDAFCREISRRAGRRGHLCATRMAHEGLEPGCDVVLLNGLQPSVLLAAKAAGLPTILRLVDSYAGASPETLAEVKRLASQAERLLLPSLYFRSLASSWGVPPERSRLVPYAYDQIFAQQIALVTMRAARPSGFGLVTAGTLDEASRPAFETVLAAASRLRLDFHLAVIGDGPAMAALKAQAGSLRLDDRATFLGDLPHPKKMEYLRAAKAYIEPSDSSGFPFLALHALSEGCPVIGVGGGPVPELIEDGRNGLLFRPGDAGDLVEKIVTLASTPGLSLHLIDQGVRTVERHSWDATAAAAIEAVEELRVRA